MKKIGIMTFHFAHNYGAMLQAFALQETIKKMNLNVEIIDYRMDNIYHWTEYPRFDDVKKFNNFFVSLLKYNISVLINRSGKNAQYKLFEKFMISDLCLSKETYYTEKSLLQTNEKYSVIICGSDQIWNSSIVGAIPTDYLLDFFHGNKIAYAASAGNGIIPEREKQVFIDCLSKFKMIGVREKSLMKCLCDELSVSSTYVLDPTLLADPSIWDSFVLNKPRKKYVLIYSVKENSEFYSYAKKIAEDNNMEILEISYHSHNFDFVKKVKNVGPREFVDLFANASHVITNSFHGVCFSLIFKRNLHLFLGDYSDRIVGLLDNLGFSVFQNQMNIILLESNHEYIRQLNKLRELSLKFLSNALCEDVKND